MDSWGPARNPSILSKFWNLRRSEVGLDRRQDSGSGSGETASPEFGQKDRNNSCDTVAPGIANIPVGVTGSTKTCEKFLRLRSPLAKFETSLWHFSEAADSKRGKKLPEN